MSASDSERKSAIGDEYFIPVEEMIRRMGRPPMKYEEAVASAPAGFEADGELDEFLVWHRAKRQRNRD